VELVAGVVAVLVLVMAMGSAKVLLASQEQLVKQWELAMELESELAQAKLRVSELEMALDFERAKAMGQDHR
jgi:hypothetical protein